MNAHIERIQKEIEPLRQQINNHKLYSLMGEVEDLKVFMKYHVYAVWDFMSLLKSLQNGLTCTSVPWFPKGDAATRFLINEIVAGEESDVDADGKRTSHFELYLDAMRQCGAPVEQISTFISSLQHSGDLKQSLVTSGTPASAAAFVDFTFSIINSNKSYLQAAIFTFGREDLIPGMFMAIINDMHSEMPETVSVFKYYLERHIEVNGDHHSHLALQMTANLCGDNEQYWQEAETAVKESLRKRIDLWDGVYAELQKRSVSESR